MQYRTEEQNTDSDRSSTLSSAASAVRVGTMSSISRRLRFPWRTCPDLLSFFHSDMNSTANDKYLEGSSSDSTTVSTASSTPLIISSLLTTSLRSKDVNRTWLSWWSDIYSKSWLTPWKTYCVWYTWYWKSSSWKLVQIDVWRKQQQQQQQQQQQHRRAVRVYVEWGKHGANVKNNGFKIRWNLV